MRHFLEKTEDISLILFLAVIVFFYIIIIRYNILRFKGKISTGFRITASVLDTAIHQTNDPKVRNTLHHLKKAYKIGIVCLIIILSVFAISSIWLERITT